MRFVECISPREGDEYLLPEDLIEPARECQLLRWGWQINHKEI